MSGELFTPREPFLPGDLRLLSDPAPFLARTRLFGRLERAFAALRERLEVHLAEGSYLAPTGLDRREGKLARGEYLEGLPYVYLDLPRYFDDVSAFTFRSLFWWGHGVSFSLILGGPHLDAYRQRLLGNVDVLQALDVHVSVAENPWDWKHGPGHTLAIRRGQEAELLRQLRGQSYLKCSRFLSFEEEDFRESRIDQAGILTFQAFEPIVLA